MRSVWICRAVEKQAPLSHRSHSRWKSQGDSRIPTHQRRFPWPPSQPKPKAKILCDILFSGSRADWESVTQLSGRANEGIKASLATAPEFSDDRQTTDLNQLLGSRHDLRLLTPATCVRGGRVRCPFASSDRISRGRPYGRYSGHPSLEDGFGKSRAQAWHDPSFGPQDSTCESGYHSDPGG